MKRLPLRLRLTVLVSTLFLASSAVIAVVTTQLIENRLITDIQAATRTLALDYAEALANATPQPSELAEGETTTYLFFDEDGNEVDEGQVLAAVFPIDQLFEDLSTGSETLEVLPDSIAPEGGNGQLGTIEMSPGLDVAVGQPTVLDRGVNVTVAAVPIDINGQQFQIAVSSPLRAARESAAAIGRGMLWAVPALTLLIGTGTWLLVGRALQPVHQITTHVDRINTGNLGDRVPQPNSEDELAHLARTMNKMLGRLQSSQDAQRRFISDASHELRSPITAVQTTIEVTLQSPESADWPHLAQVVQDENTRLAKLVDDLLVLARVDETGLANRESDVDLDELLLEEANRPHRHPVHLTVRQPARIRGDASALAQTIRNLVDNAVHHAESSVSVTLDTTHQEAIIEIIDDGPGIPEKDLERVFDRFTRLDASRSRKTGGAGLGLAIAKKITENHKGTITAGPADSGGACFQLRLPLPIEG